MTLSCVIASLFFLQTHKPFGFGTPLPGKVLSRWSLFLCNRIVHPLYLISFRHQVSPDYIPIPCRMEHQSAGTLRLLMP